MGACCVPLLIGIGRKVKLAFAKMRKWMVASGRD
jgi:hypothetical protein